jgi:hypothetical protein
MKLENNSCLKLLPGLLQLDHDSCQNMNAILGPCHDGIMELRSGHYVKVVEITENTSKCLDEDYLVHIFNCRIYLFLGKEMKFLIPVFKLHVLGGRALLFYTKKTGN